MFFYNSSYYSFECGFSLLDRNDFPMEVSKNRSYSLKGTSLLI